MGLSIHYNGKLRSNEMLSSLIDEVRNVAEIHDWPYHVFENAFSEIDFGKEEFDDSLYGICISPPECEPLCFTFLSNGTLCSLISFSNYTQTRDKSLMHGVSVKTQFAGPSVHKLIIHLCDHFSVKYLTDFELIDEGEYWINRDEEKLDQKFIQMNFLLDQVEEAIKTVKIPREENFEDYFKALLRKLKVSNDQDSPQ